MRRYSYKKNYAWTPEVAYITGIFASDGCLLNNGRHLNITSRDTEILELAIKTLGIRAKIGTKKNGFGGTGSYIQFSDVSLYDFLLKAGLTPAKSKTIAKVDVPDDLFGDFLRGLFDGDGTVYGYWDRRWRSSFMYYVEFTSASNTFLEWLQAKNKELIGIKGGKIKPGVRALKLSYSKCDSQILFSYMYYKNCPPSLSRKRKKFTEFLNIDPNYKVFIGRVAER